MRLRPSDIIATRDPAIDLVRFIAMAMVVCIYAASPFFYCKTTNMSWALHTTSLPAVPLFFMCSGYLLLGSDARASYRYVFRRIWRVLRFCLIFTGMVYGLIYLFGDPSYSYTDVPLHIWKTHGDFFFLWFMIAYAFVLLLYPLVDRLYRSPRTFGIALSVVLSLMTIAFIADLKTCFSLSLPDPPQIWLWVGYFMLGGAMRHIILPRRIFVWGLPLIWAATIAATYWIYHSIKLVCSYDTLVYASPYCIIYTCWIFLLCLESGIRPSRPLAAVASLFVPVYTLHAFVIEYLLSYMPWTQPGSCFGLSFCSFAITLLLSWLITRIPPVRALFTI